MVTSTLLCCFLGQRIERLNIYFAAAAGQRIGFLTFGTAEEADDQEQNQEKPTHDSPPKEESLRCALSRPILKHIIPAPRFPAIPPQGCRYSGSTRVAHR